MDKPTDQEKNNNNPGDPAEGSQTPAGGNGPINGQSNASTNDLPIVESPDLSGGDPAEDRAAAISHPRGNAESAGSLPALYSRVVDDAPRGPASRPDTQQRSLRFALLAATIACAAGIGALVGSLSASGMSGRHAAAAAMSKSADAHDVLHALKIQRAELSALKASLDGANRSAGAQFAKISDRLNTLERAQTEPSAKLARIAEEVEQLEKRTAGAPDVTGSIAKTPSTIEAKHVVPVLHDWIVQDVRNGRAMIENRFGALFLVGTGSLMPGLGRVQEVKRQNGAWIVVTEKGLITSHP
ncbi:MAG: hypothetical protein ACRECV_02150 [Xanthobacteraceae bacterium]